MNRAKQYLARIGNLDTMITQRQEQALQLRSTIVGISAIRYDKEAVQTSPEADRMTDQLDKYYKMLNDIEDMLCEYEDVKNRIIGQIHQMKDRRYMTVLFKRYVLYESLEKIAKEENYDYDWVRKLHGFALDEFDRQFLRH